MSDLERKPKVVFISTGGAKVVPSEKVRIWQPIFGNPSPEDASTFVASYREFVKLAPTYGFMGLDLERMVCNSNVAPIRFVYEIRARTNEGNVGHWMLYLRILLSGQLRVYDPVVGVKDLTKQENIHKLYDVMFNDPNTQAKWGPERIEQHGKLTVIHKDLLNRPTEEKFQVNETPLSKLGPLQRNAYDCGPLCVYAGLVARKPN